MVAMKMKQLTLKSLPGVVVIEDFIEAKNNLEDEKVSSQKKIEILKKLLSKSPCKEVLVQVGIGKTVYKLRKINKQKKVAKLSEKVYRKWRNELERKVELKYKFIKDPKVSTKQFQTTERVKDEEEEVTVSSAVRRSERKPKSELIKTELEKIISQLGQSDDSDRGITVAPIENKGRGIKAVKNFKKGDFVVEYAGKLIDIGTAKDLETKYSMDEGSHCYMYYFKHREKQYCVDATSESGRYGRLVNHSRVSPNCVTKVINVDDVPRLILVAKHYIEAGTEILYDYGDRSKESLTAHPWLAL